MPLQATPQRPGAFGNRDVTGILAIYNEVVRTFAAMYTEQEATLDDRPAWFAQRAGQGYPVLVAMPGRMCRPQTLEREDHR